MAASEWINPVVAIFSMLCTSVKYSHWIRTLARPRSVNRRIPLVAVIFANTGSTMPIRCEYIRRPALVSILSLIC